MGLLDNLAQAPANLGSALQTPEFWQWFSNVGAGLDRSARGQGFDLSQANAGLMQGMQQRQQADKIKGLMGDFPLNEQQRAVMGSLPVDMQQQILARQAFPAGEKQPGDVREYEYYRQQAAQVGQEPLNFMDYQTALKRAGRTNVSVTTGAGEKDRYLYGSDAGLPAGWRIDRTTGEASPTPGGPAAVEAAQAAQAGTAAAENTARSGGVVLEDIRRVQDMVKNSTLPVTGLAGSYLKKIPGTNAYDAGALTETIKANIGFDRLQQMREASPTGGALGQVTERELATLQAVLGSLDQAQSEQQFTTNLGRLEKIYTDVMKKASAYPNAGAFGFDGGGPAAPAQPPQTKTIGGKKYEKRGGKWGLVK